MAEAIAAQLPESEVDFFAAGGLQYFVTRSDGQDYFSKLSLAGFEMDSTALKQPDQVRGNNKYGFLLAADAMPKMSEGRGSFLSDATNLALDFFKKRGTPFFMMVEASQIDWGGHGNDADYLMSEVQDFNHTLGHVLDFAEADGNTLVVVTADHETGGFALASGENYQTLNGSFSTGGHTATLVPVYAFGPGAEKFNGIYQNTGIYDRMLQATGW